MTSISRTDFCYYNKPDVLFKNLNPVLDCLIKQDPEAVPFRQPVDAELLNVPDYHKIIKQPMDLSTIRTKLSTGQYKNSWEFIDDVWLMFDNAHLYNKKSTRVYKYCSKLIDLFKSIIDEPMMRLGHCCGQNYRLPPKLLVCSSQKDCVIPKFVHYWSYNNRFQLCKQCFSEIKDDFVVIHCATGAVSIKKDDFVENFHDEEKKEPFVECFNCGIKVHKICVLFLEDIWKEGYLCDNCLNCLSKVRVPNKYTSDNLQKTNLSTHIEEWVNNFLNNKGCNSKVIVRLVYNGNKKVEVKKCAKKRFVDNGIWPESFPYTPKTILAFQKMRGKDICFFAMFVQEYDLDCPQPNARRVYISYLDSIHFFTPKELRTVVYHEILLGYFDYVRKRGFTTVHLWSCPSKKGEDYVFYSHPDDQKHPTIKKLVDWYKVMLDKGITDGIVQEYKDIYKYIVENNIQDVCELPYFEGDILPLSLEKEISKLEGNVNSKVSTSSIKKTALSLLNKEGGENIYESKDESIVTTETSKTKKTKPKKGVKISCPPVVDTLTERIFEFLFQFKQVFLVIQLLQNSNVPEAASNMTPDPLISSQLLHSREEFLEFCRDKNYLFSSLRHAKFSTMILLYELVNEKIDLCHCNQCNKVIKTGFHCSFCTDFDLCTDCYSNLGHNHRMEDFKLNLESKSYVSISDATRKNITCRCKNLKVSMNKNNQLIGNKSTRTLNSGCDKNFSNGFLAINNSISSSFNTSIKQIPPINKYETKLAELKNSNSNYNGYLNNCSVICTSTPPIYNQSNQITTLPVSNNALPSSSSNSVISSTDFSGKHKMEATPSHKECSSLYLVKLSKASNKEKESTFSREANMEDPNLQTVKSENPFLTALFNQNNESFTPLLPPHEVNNNLELFSNLPYNEKSDVLNGPKNYFDHNYTASKNNISVSSVFNNNYEHSATPDISQNIFTPISINAMEEPLFQTSVNQQAYVNKNIGFSQTNLPTYPNDILNLPFTSYHNSINVERPTEKPMHLVNSKSEPFSAISVNQSCSPLVSNSETSSSKDTITYPVWSTVNDFSSKLPTVTTDNLSTFSENFCYKKTPGSMYESSASYSENNVLPQKFEINQAFDGFLVDSNKGASSSSENMPVISKVGSPVLHPTKIAAASNINTFGDLRTCKRKYESDVSPNTFNQETSSGGLSIKRILLSQNHNPAALNSPILSNNALTSVNISPNYNSPALNLNQCLLPNAINNFQVLDFKLDSTKASVCQPVPNVGDAFKVMENRKERQSYEMTLDLKARVSSASSKNILPINYCKMSSNKDSSEDLFSSVNDHLTPTFFNTKSDNTSNTHETFKNSPVPVSVQFQPLEVSSNQHVAESNDKLQNCLKSEKYTEYIGNNSLSSISQTSLIPLSNGKIITNNLSQMQPFHSEMYFNKPVGQIKTSAVNSDENVQVPNYTVVSSTNSFNPLFSENDVAISKDSKQNQSWDFLQSSISSHMTDQSQSLYSANNLITKNSMQSSPHYQNILLSRTHDVQNSIFQNDLNTDTKSIFSESNNIARNTSTSTEPTYLIFNNSNTNVISDYSSNLFSSVIEEAQAKNQISLLNDQNSVHYVHLKASDRSITCKKNNTSLGVPLLLKPTYLSFDKNGNESSNFSSKISSLVTEGNKIKTQVPLILGVSKATANVNPTISTSNASFNLSLNNPTKSFSYVLTNVPSHWRLYSGLDSNGNFKANAEPNRLLQSGKSEIPKKQLNKNMFLSNNKTVKYASYCTENNVNYSQAQTSVNEVTQTALFLQQPQYNSDASSSQLTPAKRQKAAKKIRVRKKKLV